MRKILLLVFTICAFQISFAQYNQASLNGPWFIELTPANPYGEDSLTYIVFDGAGNIVTFSGFCSTIGGTYTVSSSGVIGGNLTCDGGSYPMSGQLTSTTTGTAFIDKNYNLVKVANPGALATTLTGTLNADNCGSANVSFTLDNNGNVIASTGLTNPVSGRIYSEGGMFLGHITTGGSSGWNAFSIMGYYSSNTLTGKIELDQNGCGNSSVNLTRNITKIDEINLSEISLYPNPAFDIVTLQVDKKSNADLILNIYNVMGSLVKTETLKQNQQQINVSDLINGIYLVEIKSEDFRSEQKLIIQR